MSAIQQDHALVSSDSNSGSNSFCKDTSLNSDHSGPVSPNSTKILPYTTSNRPHNPSLASNASIVAENPEIQEYFDENGLELPGDHPSATHTPRPSEASRSFSVVTTLTEGGHRSRSQSDQSERVSLRLRQMSLPVLGAEDQRLVAESWREDVGSVSRDDKVAPHRSRRESSRVAALGIHLASAMSVAESVISEFDKSAAELENLRGEVGRVANYSAETDQIGEMRRETLEELYRELDKEKTVLMLDVVSLKNTQIAEDTKHRLEILRHKRIVRQ
eukprot:82328_1